MSQSGSTRSAGSWQLRTRRLETGRRTLVMGVVNVTPDSFSDGGRFLRPGAAIERALEQLDEGADIVDVGAESTRPGSRAGGDAPAVSAGEEEARLAPVLEGILRARPGAILSVDTYKAQTARAALGLGAEIINDVSGLAWDPELAGVLAGAGPGVILTHTRGRPDQWEGQERLAPHALVEMVRRGLEESLGRARAAGIDPDRIALDPGYGFGKRLEENFSLLARQEEMMALARPLAVGLSRKSFLGRAPVDRREIASIAAMVAAILHGASIVRVHAVGSAVEAARIADEVLAAG